MSKRFKGYINLSRIPKQKIQTSDKTGDKYLNVVMWINDEPDRFGNDMAIQVDGKSDEAKELKPYIGNAKEPTIEPKPEPKDEANDDLPF